MSTPHIEARNGDFAKTVLMPGDPLRAKYIAEHFLENAKLVNNVRGIHGYTGVYKGTRVSVMASGMGIPSMGIYAQELYTQFDVENIIRIGSAGAISPELKLRDIVVGLGAATNSNFAKQYRLPGYFPPVGDYTLLKAAEKVANAANMPLHVGVLFSSDTFYDDSDSLKEWQKMGALAVEMEAAGLYYTAARFGKRALAICTISDCPLTGESSSAKEREQTFTQMMHIALEMAVIMEA